MKQSILLVRSSTYRQEIDSQIRDLTSFARQYTQGELVVIGNAGASAIKQDEMYQCQMSEVERLVQQGDIECVYAWELSRIGRNEETFAKFKSILIKNKVQLRIYQPSLVLLNPDGSINDGMSLAFSLFANLSEQEMRNKKERFKRGKERNKREGKYNGGYVSFGYKVDDNGYFAIDEDAAKEVRQIFLEYVSGNEGLDKMSKRTGRKCNAIIKNKQYIGADGFPPIIEKELFELAAEKRRNCRNNPRSKDIYPDYCHKLIWCKVLDLNSGEISFHRMTIQRSCSLYENRQYQMYIGINSLDWATIQVLDIILDKCDFATYERLKHDRMETIYRQLEKLSQDWEKISQRADKLEEDYYVTGRVKNYERYRAMLDAELQSNENERLALETELAKLDESTFRKPDLYNMTDAERQQVCQHYINRVILETSDGTRKTISYIFQNMPVNGCGIVLETKKKQFYFTNQPEQWITVRKIKKEKRQRLLQQIWQ